MKLASIIKSIEEHFPLYLEEKWDNSGLVLGDKNAEISKVQISLDVTESVIDRAIKNKVDLIISHHPLIFESIKKINDSTILGKKILKLLKNNINVYSMHTNLDSGEKGLNDYVVEKLGGTNSKVMNEVQSNLFKISLYITEDYMEKAMEIVENTNKIKLLSIVELIEKNKSFKVELIGEKEDIYLVLNKIKGKKIDEDIKYEIKSLENKKKLGVGLGRVYSLEKPIELEKYAEIIKEKLNLDFLKIVKSNEKLIKKIAIINGSGAEFWKKAYDLGADVFVTSDIKYHVALDAYEKGLNLIDIGHYESEHFFNEIIIKKLSDNLTVEVYNEKRILKTF